MACKGLGVRVPLPPPKGTVATRDFRPEVIAPSTAEARVHYAVLWNRGMRDAAIGQIECSTSSSRWHEWERQLIRKAVIAAAARGSRCLPQTKAMPKTRLPRLDKPSIQYIVEELVEAGIEDIVIVT